MQKTGVYKRALAKTRASRQASRYKSVLQRRNQTRYLRNQSMVRTGVGFPKMLKMTQKYVEQVNFQTGSLGALATYSFSCNGMYDPNITGTGHQPMYFDQLGALYDHYCVIASKITVTFTKGDTQTTMPVTVGIYVNDDSTVTPTIFGIMENSLATSAVIHAGQPTAVCKLGWSAAKYFGKSPLANTELQGTTSGNPTEQSMFTLFIDSSLGLQVGAALATVEIEYIAIWKELRDIASS